jgi:hypothetical protein
MVSPLILFIVILSYFLKMKKANTFTPGLWLASIFNIILLIEYTYESTYVRQ